jgi:hypothetical protein
MNLSAYRDFLLIIPNEQAQRPVSTKKADKKYSALVVKKVAGKEET